jgi:hypothetical protein
VRRLAVLPLLLLVTAGCADDAPVPSGSIEAAPTAAAVRTEAWHDLAVDVPADWGWGSAPAGLGPGGASLCGGPGPTSERPYVGRPIATSDVCFAVDQLGIPSAPYVWLGSPVEPGTIDLGSGWVQQTVAAQGTTLTVGADDPALRRAVLESAREVTDCPGGLSTVPNDLPMPTEGIDSVDSALLCAYARENGVWRLTYAQTLPAAEGQVLKDALFAGQRRHPELCTSPAQFVVATFTGTGPYGDAGLRLGALVDPSCRTTTGGATAPLPQAVLEIWRKTGLGFVLSELIGPMG